MTTPEITHLLGPFYWLERTRFLNPGLYLNARRIIPLPRLVGQPEIIEFPEQTVVIAKEQPQYRPLPAYRRPDSQQGEIVCCWKLSLAARVKLLFTGKLWHSIWTFNQPLQPQLLLHTKPNMPATPANGKSL